MAHAQGSSRPGRPLQAVRRKGHPAPPRIFQSFTRSCSTDTVPPVPVVDAKGVGKAYAAKTLLKSVNLTVRTGERVGVVGLNGAGKSTLARILAGLEPPDAGSVNRRRGARVMYLAQAPTFDGNPSAEDVVGTGLGAWNEAMLRHARLSQELSRNTADASLLEQQTHAAEEVERLGGWDQQHRVRTMLATLGIAEASAPVATMSGGEQRRVALAQVLVAAPDLAILDEPTNHLDAETVEWLEQFLINEFAGALLLVTHDRYLLNSVATRTVEISDGQLFSYDGGYELYLEQKAERMAHAERTERNRQNFLRTELEWLRRQPKARGTKQKARIERAEQAVKQRGPRAEKQFNFEVDVARQGKRLLELSDLTLQVGGRTLVKGLDLILSHGERLGVIGANGTGKTTLLRTILGQLQPTSGRVTLGATAKLVYFDQNRSDLLLDASVFDNVVGDQTHIELSGRELEPHAYLERFGFSGKDQRQLVGSLSGGERARVALARLLRRSANLVILDEPTNDLDVASLAALEELLLEFSVSALVVTHDRWFLDRVATSILAFEGDARVVHYAGNYQALQHARRASKQATARTSAPKPEARPERKRRKGLTWSEARELEGLLDRIDAAEAEVARLSHQMSLPETYSGDASEIAVLTTALETARSSVEDLTARWEELETKRGDAV